jgi:hypothetical protein
MFFSFDDEDPKAAGKGPVAIPDATFLTARRSDGYLNLSNRYDILAIVFPLRRTSLNFLFRVYASSTLHFLLYFYSNWKTHLYESIFLFWYPLFIHMAFVVKICHISP